MATARVEDDAFYGLDLKFAGPVPDTLGEDMRMLDDFETEERFQEDSTDLDAQGGYDVEGHWISGDLLAAGRKSEMEWLERQGVFREVPLKECWDETGRRPFDLKWVDKTQDCIGWHCRM